jgi:hypothetical protein
LPVDPSPIIVCAAAWRPRAAWASTLRPAYEALLVDDRDARAWAEVAMMMGDTRAAPLALVVCLHAESFAPDSRLASHRNLCLLDLGLAHADGPVRLVELDNPDVVTANVSALEAWLARALIPFDGGLNRAAWFALRTACLRTGILDGPDPAP